LPLIHAISSRKARLLPDIATLLRIFTSSYLF
jgi:hypothetical protein